MDEKTFREELTKILRTTNGQISMYDLAKKLDINVDNLLRQIVPIKDEYMILFKSSFKKMIEPNNKGFMEQFFKKPIVDLGFLVQHRIKEIADSLKDKHDTMGHQMFYDSWILYRGY